MTNKAVKASEGQKSKGWRPSLFTRFILIGTLNAVVTIIIIWICMHPFNLDYRVSNVIGYILGQIHNFLWSKYWVFANEENKERNTIRQAIMFIIAFGSAFTAQYLFMISMVNFFGMNEFWTQWLGLIVFGAVNFTMNKIVTFK